VRATWGRDRMVERAASDEAARMEPQRDIIKVVVVDDHAAITNPDVVVLDYRLPHVNGLVLCRRIKQEVLAPAVLLYSAYADPALVVPALVAGADAVVHRGAPARELLQAIRAVSAGEARFPAPIPELTQDAAAAVEPDDRPILELLVNRVPRDRIAARLGLSAVARGAHRSHARRARRTDPDRHPRAWLAYPHAEPRSASMVERAEEQT
jgi:DNA-binding NarL/FixJ family response regulator